MVALFWMWKKGKLGKLRPSQNPYVRRMKRDAQLQRVAKVEVERRTGGAAIDRGHEMAPITADPKDVIASADAKA
jgi:hypothetical protein